FETHLRIGYGQHAELVAESVCPIARVGRAARVRQRLRRLEPALEIRSAAGAGELNYAVREIVDPMPDYRRQMLISRKHQRARLAPEPDGRVAARFGCAVRITIGQWIPVGTGLHAAERRLRQAD